MVVRLACRGPGAPCVVLGCCCARVTRKGVGQRDLTVHLSLPNAPRFCPAASYFGQVCSTGLSEEGTECIMGEPQGGAGHHGWENPVGGPYEQRSIKFG